MTEAIPGARYAFQVIHPGSPVLRVRYRQGLTIGPHGFPDWIPYARALVSLPASTPDLGLDESRVVDVLTANAVLARAGDPLWRDAPPLATPAGWTWAHLAMSRQVALVPVELHGACRHLGGVSTANADRSRRGLPLSSGEGAPGGRPPGEAAVPARHLARLAPEVLEAIEERLGRLPAGYRDFLAETNGGPPARPAVHPRFGFVADQPLFGVARRDRMQDLVYANAWFGDRLTSDFIAIGYVQGGLLALRVGGGDEGSVWYWDDDDHRDREAHTAEDICARLLHRCADDFPAFWRALREPPAVLRDLADSNAAGGHARQAVVDGMGAALPKAQRPPGGVS